ncbi:F-box/WD-40 repeat-containing protein [Hibiscus syriacus]|uniref:F-box/WD-40 repeat-containing protein n=1 Tax=Hibiscus syriacus TaxID=106335 RepID=A0A6A2WZB9_HIBSY|nr:transmembrane protein 45A-like [Hibiscus syriacus]KAE8667532.1 F-box/WD-40 repeat-containing protein [Hibiscus syriacus]
MGSLVGHVAPGLAFFLLGFWHLFNHIKLHSVNPSSYTSIPWFPTPKSRHLELFLIMIATSISISMELFIGPARHQPFDPDGTIPSNHLHNFEHSSISMTFFTYAAFAILLDKVSPAAAYSLTQFIAAIAFAQQLLLFHFHSADHMGIEGQYHLLLQNVIFVSLTTTLMGIGFPKSFMVSFIRSISIFYQGVWLIVMGFMIWTPSMISKGCFLHFEDGHQVVNCSSNEALHRAKSLVNILFSWTLIAITVYSVAFYLVLAKLYGEKVVYSTLNKEEELEVKVKEESDDFEYQKGQKVFAVMDVER